MPAVLLLQARPRAVSWRRRLVLAALAGLLVVGAVAVLAVLKRTPDAGLPDRPPGLADLWSGRASLVLDRKWTSTALGQPAGGAYAGAHIEIVGDTWYLFNRRTDAEECPGKGPKLGMQVRSSDDRGASWSEPTTILPPTPGTPWACAATDGDAYYDAGAGIWRYVFQCQDETRGWSGCYAERHAPSPLGRFSAPAPDFNPVISPGTLWGPICDDPGDQCLQPPGSRPTVDEGTYNLLPAPDGGWWVGFHGSDGTRGWRGLARTSTFAADDWQVDGEAGTPTDAVIDAADAAGWRETWREGGPIGAGAASIQEENGWYYQLAEVADVSLGCTSGQTWDLGLFRTRQLSSTTWEQYPAGNPIVYSSRAPGGAGESEPCNVQYPGLFRDPDTGVTYLMHGRMTGDAAYDGIYVYRLEWDRNLLENGDFARADVHGWGRTPGAAIELAAERAPDKSPDGTPDLAFSCGASCTGGVQQEVGVPAGRAGETLAFGGSFRAESGAGALELTVEQLDAAGAPIASQALPVSAGGTYAPVRGTVKLDGRAARLRLTIVPRSPGTLRADNLYVIPQDGCSAPRYPVC